MKAFMSFFASVNPVFIFSLTHARKLEGNVKKTSPSLSVLTPKIGSMNNLLPKWDIFRKHLLIGRKLYRFLSNKCVLSVLAGCNYGKFWCRCDMNSWAYASATNSNKFFPTCFSRSLHIVCKKNSVISLSLCNGHIISYDEWDCEGGQWKVWC